MGLAVPAGTTRQVELQVSETATHQPLSVPVTLARGPEDGPVLFVTGAVHGDEVNGVAIVRRVLDRLQKEPLVRGTLIAVPIANRFGFDAQDRYLPDRRDLNRSFPGEADGSLAARVAHRLFTEVVQAADAGIDLHTAAGGNANLCHIRGDADDKAVRPLMKAFGTPILLHGEGPKGSLRRAATQAGVPTIVFEAGEPRTFQRRVVEVGTAGVWRVLQHLGMAAGRPAKTPLQIVVRDADWVRSDHGGILELAVQPGELVRKGQVMGSITDPLGSHVDDVEAPRDGIVLGVCTWPLVHPGVALVHVGRLKTTFHRAAAFVAGGGDLGTLGGLGAAPRVTG
jgi:hypothetical protein